MTIDVSEQILGTAAPCMNNSIAMRHHAIRQESEEFVQSEIKPFLTAIRRQGQMPPEVIDSLRRSGFFGLLIPKEFGGRGLDCLARILNVEYVARGCPDVGAVLQIGQLGTGSLIEFADEAQRKRWLPQLASGERICTIAITEEQSGSHVLGMNTTYVDHGDHFVLNGEKCFIGNCPISNLHVVYAREENGKKLSAFIVEGERPGVDNGGRQETAGLRAFPFGRLRLTDVTIPRENLLGRLGQGREIAYRVIAHHGRPSLTALALGIHHRILDLVYAFSARRELYGRSIRAIPDVRFKVFDIYQRYEVCRQSAYEAAHLESIGAKSFRALALAKYLNGEYVCQSALVAADMLGARAGIPEYDIAQLTLDAMMTRPPSGTGDVQRRRILEDFFGEKIPPWEVGDIDTVSLGSLGE